MIRKYLPPGNLSELFQHYEAVQISMGASAASILVGKRQHNMVAFARTCIL